MYSKLFLAVLECTLVDTVHLYFGCDLVLDVYSRLRSASGSVSWGNTLHRYAGYALPGDVTLNKSNAQWPMRRGPSHGPCAMPYQRLYRIRYCTGPVGRRSRLAWFREHVRPLVSAVPASLDEPAASTSSCRP